jgi:4-hydroxybenzoate polyprenyltransferase
MPYHRPKADPFMIALPKLIRIIHWTKNLLIFVPILISHNYFNAKLVLDNLLGFIAFSLVASAGYIVNDLFDIQNDLSHPTKKYRPIADGTISPWGAFCIAVVFLIIASLFTSYLGYKFGGFLLLYFATSFLYSCYLKNFPIIDLCLLSWFYLCRVIAGGIICNVQLSPWLLAFSVLICFSFASLKRVIELKISNKADQLLKGRGYKKEDILFLTVFGISVYLCSIVFFCLYIISPTAAGIYQSPQWLWGIAPLMLYFCSLIWLRTLRGGIEDDPVKIIVKNYATYVVCVFSLIFLFLSMYS